MRLSTKGRYGVRLMLDLALHYGKGNVSLKDVAKRQAVSEKYLWHLIPPLKNAGLIHSIRGSQGGYVLAKPPHSITLKEILQVLEGPMCLVECTNQPSLCKRSANCVVRDVWRDVTDKMLEALDSFTLEGMLEKEKQRAISYSI
ncbi:MAG TPA: Rrf2 family transcriptional regulator [Syntrophobacteraceae bacterium]|nr:Rrf2 family transcriptional regulator [Syntrophobacteraceae bacterium]